MQTPSGAPAPCTLPRPPHAAGSQRDDGSLRYRLGACRGTAARNNSEDALPGLQVGKLRPSRPAGARVQGRAASKRSALPARPGSTLCCLSASPPVSVSLWDAEAGEAAPPAHLLPGRAPRSPGRGRRGSYCGPRLPPAGQVQPSKPSGWRRARPHRRFRRRKVPQPEVPAPPLPRRKAGRT